MIGKASHAAAAPWDGLNALDAAIACYTNVSLLRQQMKPTCRIHGIITNGGDKPNIIPESSELSFLVRAEEDSDMFELKERVINCAESAATATGNVYSYNSAMPF